MPTQFTFAFNEGQREAQPPHYLHFGYQEVQNFRKIQGKKNFEIKNIYLWLKTIPFIAQLRTKKASLRLNSSKISTNSSSPPETFERVIQIAIFTHLLSGIYRAHYICSDKLFTFSTKRMSLYHKVLHQ